MQSKTKPIGSYEAKHTHTLTELMVALERAIDWAKDEEDKDMYWDSLEEVKKALEQRLM